tara:strand:+ start:524 stop:850 length:327 start_codon:yes stop_codon:yes gene_type:complete
MEQSVRNAMHSLASGTESLEPHKVLKLQEQLNQVDRLFSNLRSEVTRLNSLLAEQKDISDALRAQNIRLMDEVRDLRSSTKKSTTSTKSPKSKKKKTTTKKKLTTKKK